MGAAQDIILYLRKLLLALRIPFYRSLKFILRTWSLFRYWFLFGGARRNVVKPSRGILSIIDQGSSSIVYASQAPSQSSPIIGRDSPTAGSDYIPIRVHRPTYDRLMYPDAPGSSPYEYGGEDDVIEDNACDPSSDVHGYFPDGPQRPACDSPVFASRHLEPDDAALHDSSQHNPVAKPSRSPSPASQRSRYHNSHNGAEEFALQQSVHFSTSSRPPSRAEDIEIYSSESSIDMHSRESPASGITPATPRGRSSSVRPTSRARSRTPMSGRCRRGPSPAHISAVPICRSSRPPSTTGQDPIKPCASVARYDRAVTISRGSEIQPTLPSMTVSYSYENLPSGWKPVAHPEGALYWVHEKRPIYTDAYLCDAVALDKINRFLSAIDRMIVRDNIQLPNDWELVLELSPQQEEEESWSYYFIDHGHRILFWLHPFELDEHLQAISVGSKAHIHHQIQYYYWLHWETFPHNREIPPEVIDELTGILVHAGIDFLTSPFTTSIYSEGELTKFLKFVESLKSVSGNNGYAACVVGRLMSFFANSRFLNFYGQNCARLARNQSVYDDKTSRSSLMLLSPFLFFAPEEHLRGLEDIYTDRVICNHRWTSFIGKLQVEWQEFILYATVLLNGNVGFLAIPSVSDGTNQRTAAQIVSYMSIVASAGSILTGLLLIRQYRTKRESFEDIDVYLRSQQHQTRGFATLAILYSLPYSLLMWSMISFLVAFALECLVDTAGMLPRIPLIFAWATVGVLLIWCVSTNWEWEHPLRPIKLVDTIRIRFKRVFGSQEEERTPKESEAKQKVAWYQRMFKFSRCFTRTSTLVGSPTESSNQGCGNSV